MPIPYAAQNSKTTSTLHIVVVIFHAQIPSFPVHLQQEGVCLGSLLHSSRKYGASGEQERAMRRYGYSSRMPRQQRSTFNRGTRAQLGAQETLTKSKQWLITVAGKWPTQGNHKISCKKGSRISKHEILRHPSGVPKNRGKTKRSKYLESPRATSDIALFRRSSNQATTNHKSPQQQPGIRFTCRMTSRSATTTIFPDSSGHDSRQMSSTLVAMMSRARGANQGRYNTYVMFAAASMCVRTLIVVSSH